MSRFIKALLLVALVGLPACNRNQPVYNVQDNKIPKPAVTMSLDKIKENITLAAIDRGWRVEDVNPGELRITLRWKGRSAVSNVYYNKETYSIKLDSSQNLKERDGTISKKYNAEVQLLETEIDKRLYHPTR